MKLHSPLVAAFLVLILGFSCELSSSGQTASSGDQPISVSFHDKMKLKRARDQVLSDNPGLKAEQEALVKQGKALKSDGSSVTPAQRQAFIQSMAEHEKKMRAAIVKIDPSLGPIFDEMVKQKMQEHAAQEAGGN